MLNAYKVIDNSTFLILYSLSPFIILNLGLELKKFSSTNKIHGHRRKAKAD